MRITHVVENLNRGGLERVVIDLAEQQQAWGNAVQVICLFEAGQLAPQVERLGIPLVACRKRWGLDLRAIARMRAAIRAHRPDVLHSHNAMAHYYAVAASAFTGVRRINTRHGLANVPFSRKREALFRAAMPFTDASAVVCNKARDFFVGQGIIPRRKAVTVYNGIPVERFTAKNSHARERVLAAAGWRGPCVVAGIVARLTAPKDHATLLAAMAIARASVPQLRLVLVGDGPLRPALEKSCADLQIGEAVSFLGDRSDVSELLAGFDMFVLSSISEGYSISLLEACASALPVVATDVGGNPEIIRDGRNGILVPARSPEAFAAAMVRLATDPALREEIAQRNHRFAHEEASVRAMAERYRALYGGAPA